MVGDRIPEIGEPAPGLCLRSHLYVESTIDDSALHAPDVVAELEKLRG